MHWAIRHQAERILQSGAYLQGLGCCGCRCTGGSDPLAQVTTAVHAHKEAATPQEFVKNVVAELSLQVPLEKQDLELCDFRGCRTVGDVSCALLQRIVSRCLVAESDSRLWPACRSEHGATPPIAWAASYLTCTFCCLRCYESRYPCVFDGCACGPCCLTYTRTSDARLDFACVIEAAPPLAVVSVGTCWRRVTAKYNPPFLDVPVGAAALSGKGVASVNDKTWNWPDVRKYVGLRGDDDDELEDQEHAPPPCGFRVIASEGVKLYQHGRRGDEACMQMLKCGDVVHPVRIAGSMLIFHGDKRCNVMADGVRLLEPLTRHWQVVADGAGLETFADRPARPYQRGMGSDGSKELYQGEVVVAAKGGMDGSWLQLEDGRWVPIYDLIGDRLLLPIPEPEKLTQDEPTLKVDPDRLFFASTEFPQLEELAKQWEQLRDEALKLWTERRNQFDQFEGHKGWMACALKLWGHEVPDNLAAAPVGAKALKASKIDSLTTFCYSVLEPGAHIRPHEEHQGTTSVRAHLGLKIPDGCAIRVGPYAQIWKEGSWTLFNGTRSHEVLNAGAVERVVLLIDFGGPDVETSQWPEWMQGILKERSTSGPLSPSSAMTSEKPEQQSMEPGKPPGVVENVSYWAMPKPEIGVAHNGLGF